MLFLFIFILFVLVGGFVIFLLVMLGDWRRLAKHYRARQMPEGEEFRFQSAAVGMVSYGNILTVGLSGEGLYLALFFPFSIMHPPLLIPWHEINDVREHQTFSRRTYRLSIGSPERGRLTLQQNLMQKIAPYLDEFVPPL